MLEEFWKEELFRARESNIVRQIGFKDRRLMELI
jgi:hypothetical protein